MTIQELNDANIAFEHITEVVERYRSDETTQIVAESWFDDYWLISHDFGNPLVATWHTDSEKRANRSDESFDGYESLKQWLFENYTTEDYSPIRIFEIYIENF